MDEKQKFIILWLTLTQTILSFGYYWVRPNAQWKLKKWIMNWKCCASYINLKTYLTVTHFLFNVNFLHLMKFHLHYLYVPNLICSYSRLKHITATFSYQTAIIQNCLIRFKIKYNIKIKYSHVTVILILLSVTNTLYALTIKIRNFINI